MMPETEMVFPGVVAGSRTCRNLWRIGCH